MTSRIALVVLLSLPAAAQETHRADGGITAVVTSVSGTVITVLNGVVTIDARDATFGSVNRGERTIADVEPGTQIVISIANPEAPPGTMLRAKNILIFDRPAAMINGAVQSVDPSGGITVLGARVAITPQTRISAAREDVSLDRIRPGDTVSIEVRGDAVSLIADAVHVVPATPRTAVGGTLKSMSSEVWVVTTRSGDVSVRIGPHTTIDRAITMNDVVDVIGIADAKGVITADAVFRTNPMDLPVPAHSGVAGTVKTIAAGTWVITTPEQGDVTVTVLPQTRIEPGIGVGDAVIVTVRADFPHPAAAAILKDARR